MISSYYWYPSSIRFTWQLTQIMLEWIWNSSNLKTHIFLWPCFVPYLLTILDVFFAATKRGRFCWTRCQIHPNTQSLLHTTNFHPCAHLFPDFLVFIPGSNEIFWWKDVENLQVRITKSTDGIDGGLAFPTFVHLHLVQLRFRNDMREAVEQENQALMRGGSEKRRGNRMFQVVFQKILLKFIFFNETRDNQWALIKNRKNITFNRFL